MQEPPWVVHDGKGVPPEVELRLVEVEYEAAPINPETVFVDSSTWVEYGSAWLWGTWSTRIVRYRILGIPTQLTDEEKTDSAANA